MEGNGDQGLGAWSPTQCLLPGLFSFCLCHWDQTWAAGSWKKGAFVHSWSGVLAVSLPPPHFILEGHPLALAQKAELMEGKHLRGRGTPSGWGKWELGGGRLGRQSAIITSRSHRCPGKAGRRRLEWCQLGLGGSWAQSWALGVPRGIGPSRLGLLAGAWERAATRPGTRGLSSEP